MALGADVRGFSGRISFRYQGEVLSNLAQQIPQDDQFARPNYAWDFSIRQALPIDGLSLFFNGVNITSPAQYVFRRLAAGAEATERSEEHTSELQSRGHLVCRLLLEKKNTNTKH